MSEKRDYYEVLGLGKDASQEQIKKAYKRLAMKHHPDRNKENEKEAEVKFKEIREAYAVLSNQEHRQNYDQFGHSMGGSGGSPFGQGFDFSNMGGGIFDDVFETMFGGAGRRKKPSRVQRGEDLLYELHLELEESVHGVEKTIEYPSISSCDSCDAKGTKSNAGPISCNSCNGTGQIRMSQGFLVVQQTCPKCHGSGEIIADPCGTCKGEGRVQKSKKLAVKIPEGIDEGDRIRLSGKGGAGSFGGQDGDLYIQVHLRKHKIFIRDGNDLHCDIPISFVTAALGGEVEIPTLSGIVKLKIPTETQSSSVFRLRGKGVQSVRSRGNGDLLCTVMVETPIRLDETQKEILRSFSRSLQKNTDKHNPKSSSLFSSLKSFFYDFRS
jgi:molecular chaperone DnaJ